MPPLFAMYLLLFASRRVVGGNAEVLLVVAVIEVIATLGVSWGVFWGVIWRMVVVVVVFRLVVFVAGIVVVVVVVSSKL